MRPYATIITRPGITNRTSSNRMYLGKQALVVDEKFTRFSYRMDDLRTATRTDRYTTRVNHTHTHRLIHTITEIDTHTVSPGLFHMAMRPGVSAGMCCGVVRSDNRELNQRAEHGVGYHDDKRQHPRGRNDTVGMGTRLPCPRLQGVTDGAIAFNRYGNKAKGGDADGYACGETGCE